MPSNSVMGGFSTLFIVVAVFIAIGFVAVIALIIRNARTVRKSGHNPFTLQADLATRVLDSELLSARRPIEDRLHELDALRSRGAISEAEHAAARAEVLRIG